MPRGGNHKVDNPRAKIIGVRVTPEDHAILKAYAEKHHQTITQLFLDQVKKLKETALAEE